MRLLHLVTRHLPEVVEVAVVQAGHRVLPLMATLAVMALMLSEIQHIPGTVLAVEAVLVLGMVLMVDLVLAEITVAETAVGRMPLVLPAKPILAVAVEAVVAQQAVEVLVDLVSSLSAIKEVKEEYHYGKIYG